MNNVCFTIVIDKNLPVDIYNAFYSMYETFYNETCIVITKSIQHNQSSSEITIIFTFVIMVTFLATFCMTFISEEQTAVAETAVAETADTDEEQVEPEEKVETEKNKKVKINQDTINTTTAFKYILNPQTNRHVRVPNRSYVETKKRVDPDPDNDLIVDDSEDDLIDDEDKKEAIRNLARNYKKKNEY